MTAQLLASELGNLIQESKRKNNDLRQAAEKSLEELKGIRATSEPQVAAELSQRINFVNPFVIACGTKNVKYTSIAVVCLQRLIIAKALPRSKLGPVLEALRESTSAGLDVQLKILQALPSLLQNYAADVKGDLLVTALNICFILQSSKNAIVNNTSAATLQQLVVSVFDKVVAEDKSSTDAPAAGEAPVEKGTIRLREAALDAHRVFNDVCLMTENQRPEHLRLTTIPQTFGLELIESVLTNHAAVFTTHPEQAHILRTRVMPFLISSLSGRANFATTVRTVRILYTLLKRHVSILVTESREALDIMTRLLDQETALWKRSLCMEVFRGIFAEPALLRRIYALYDAREGEKPIVKNLTAAFVRLSTEKPSVIGLGHQSTVPTANPYGNIATDQVMLETGGVTGLMTGTGSPDTSNNTGISTQWSTVRVPCIDQLDKAEPPQVPESYVYSLTLSCMTSLSEGMAKLLVPLTVSSDRSRKRGGKHDAGRDSPAPAAEEAAGDSQGTTSSSKTGLERSASFKKNPVPVNPLRLESHPLHSEVLICASMVDECWPAILATCSTFLYAALDSEYYHGLVRAFQKFAHVAGILQLATPRDAFLTTLGKAAVPPNVFTACLNAGTPRPSTPTPTTATAAAGAETGSGGGLFSNARGLLSVDNLPAGTAAENTGSKPRQMSADGGPPSTGLNTRNLLCLRALLNLGIALGPTLGASWRIVLETLQQADLVLFSTGRTAGRTPTAARAGAPDAQAEAEVGQLLANFAGEVRAVETAASRLLESTVDFPNDAFVDFVVALCNLLEHRGDDDTPAQTTEAAGGRPATSSSYASTAAGLVPGSAATGGAPSKAPPHRRQLSISTAHVQPGGGSAAGDAANQEDQFALAKLGDVATINMERLLAYPPDVSGWTQLTTELSTTADAASAAAPVRLRAAEILVRIVLLAASEVATREADDDGSSSSRGSVQRRLLEALRDALAPLLVEDRRASPSATLATHATDIDVHRVILDGLKSLLETRGETLVAGWELVFEIIGTVFAPSKDAAARRPSDGGAPPPLPTRSPRLVRAAFGSLQLVCSDFLDSLPNSCFLILVDTLYKFCSQDDDLNIALTTVTFFWVLSDFLSNKTRSLSITEKLLQESSDTALIQMAADPRHPASDAALWMLLLLRLTTVTADRRLELRNSAIQTLLRIFDAYGDRLSPEAWSICIKSVVFRLLTSIEAQLETVARADDDSDEEDNEKEEPAKAKAASRDRSEWNETAVVVLNGIAGLLANYLDVLTVHPSFNASWEELLGHFAALLDHKVLDINWAAFKALEQILSRSHVGERESLDKTAVTLAWDLWARGVPVGSESAAAGTGKTTDNHKCLLAYVDALNQIYRLMHGELTRERVQRMLLLLREATEQASVGSSSWGSDVDTVTPLQGRILDVLKTVRTDIPGVPSAMIEQVAEFASLAFREPAQASVASGRKAKVPSASAASGPGSKRTYVAMSKASMSILQSLILRHALEPDVYSSGAFQAALSALRRPIELKYQFTPAGSSSRSVPSWRHATSSAIAILEATLPHLSGTTKPVVRVLPAALDDIWTVVVAIANAIVDADVSTVSSSAATLLDDEDFDIANFHRLRDLLVPALGSASLPERVRTAYAQGLFRTSIVHTPPASEVALVSGLLSSRDKVPQSNGDGDDNNAGTARAASGLAALLRTPRLGRTRDPLPTRRSRMAYVCLDELVALVASQEDKLMEMASTPSITVQPPTPRFPPPRPSNADDDDDSSPEPLHKALVCLARTAAPFLLLRAALALRGYAADQPLRGHMPTPLSQRTELLTVLRCLVALRCDPGVFADAGGDGAGSDGGSAGEDGSIAHKTRHLLRLYPLLVAVGSVAGRCGDDEVAACVAEALDVVGTGLCVSG